MRVLLAQPPLLPAPEVMPPVGLCTLAAWLRAAGHDVHVADLDLECRARSDPHAYLSAWDAALAEVRPAVVGVTSMYSNSLQGERMIRAAKRRDPAVATVAGGSHFGALGARALARIGELDFAVEGEGELAFGALLRTLDGGGPLESVPRLHWRADGEARFNAETPLLDLADVPPVWPTLEGCVDVGRYAATIPRGAPRRTLYVEAGRGCPFRCTFCATAPFWQHRYRVKTPERLVDEIRWLHEGFGYDSFVLVHDLLTANRRFVSAFCDAMLQARLPVEWMANSRTDLDLRGLLPKMKAAGCWKLFFGVESASARVQADIDKHLTVGEAEGTLRDLAEHGIAATCSFVIGFPGETPADLSPTLELGARLKLKGAETVQFHRLRLFPPSRMSRGGATGEFDLESARIEYPFPRIPGEDVDALRADPEFFSGYFTPGSAAGSPEQLAQVEMFFHHAVALAPLTVRVMGRLLGGMMAPSFYAALAAEGGLAREALDWEGGRFQRNWLALAPLFDAWIGEHAPLADEARPLLRELLCYEERRLWFVTGGRVRDDALAWGAGWTAFSFAYPMAQVVDAVAADGEPPATPTPALIVFAETGDGFAAFTVDPSLESALHGHDPALLRIFEGAAA